MFTLCGICTYLVKAKAKISPIFSRRNPIDRDEDDDCLRDSSFTLEEMLRIY